MTGGTKTVEITGTSNGLSEKSARAFADRARPTVLGGADA